MKTKPLILTFVCVGNKNRSPFSQFFFRKLMDERDKELSNMVEITSAGFVPQAVRASFAQLNISFPEPFFNRPISKMTETILHQKGIAVAPQWRTKELTPKMVEEATLIITALPMQKDELLMLYPEAEGKIFSVREMAACDEYLVFEDFDFDGLPQDNTYWDYVEENPEYITRVVSEIENLLVHSYPYIIEKLTNRSTA